MPRTPVASTDDWRFSAHARRRTAERGFCDSDLQAVLTDPDVTYTQTNYGSDRQVRQRGDLALVVDPATRTVITALYRNPDRAVSAPRDR